MEYIITIIKRFYIENMLKFIKLLQILTFFLNFKKSSAVPLMGHEDCFKIVTFFISEFAYTNTFTHHIKRDNL
jgi:hypothetical protein